MFGSTIARVTDQLVTTAEETPDSRERSVDVLRAVAIALVVLGHWLAFAITDVNGVVDGGNALAVLQWAHPLTWLFQVMPLFFVIGGYANAASLASNRRAGGDALGWVVSRLERIVWPATALLVVLAALVPVTGLFGVDGSTASSAVWAASIPLWFLAAYVAVLLLAPLTEAIHRRVGLTAIAAFAVVIVVADATRLAGELDQFGAVNHLVVWVTFHQLGYAWRDGRLAPTPAIGVPLAALGFGAAALLVTVGPYPTSMVGVPGEELQNTAPPTLALFALGVGQLGLALAMRNRIERLAERPKVWLAVVALNAVILTVFLWHMAAALVAAVLLHGTGLLPVVAVDSGAWLAWRLVWLPACLLALVPTVVLAGGLELSVPGARKGRVVDGAWARVGWAGAAAVLVGLLGIALAGDDQHGPMGLPTWTLVAYGVGVGALVATRRADRPAEEVVSTG